MFTFIVKYLLISYKPPHVFIVVRFVTLSYKIETDK